MEFDKNVSTELLTLIELRYSSRIISKNGKQLPYAICDVNFVKLTKYTDANI